MPRIRGLSPFAGGCVHQESLRLEVVVLKTLEVKPRGAGFGGVKHLMGPEREGRRRSSILAFIIDTLEA